MGRILEVCVDSPEGLKAAKEGGADRVELCSALALGGLTPTLGLTRYARALGLPTVAMIRPRAGDFVWSAVEVGHMCAEIDGMVADGVAGVVLGANLADGRLDTLTLARLLTQATKGVERVLHRSIDLTPDPVAAVDEAVALGFDRILTSGGAVKAMDGLATIKAMIERAAGRIEILPGSGITAENVGLLLDELAVDQVHASCSIGYPQDWKAVAMGFTVEARRETDAGLVRAMRSALQ